MKLKSFIFSFFLLFCAKRWLVHHLPVLNQLNYSNFSPAVLSFFLLFWTHDKTCQWHNENFTCISYQLNFSTHGRYLKTGFQISVLLEFWDVDICIRKIWRRKILSFSKIWLWKWWNFWKSGPENGENFNIGNFVRNKMTLVPNDTIFVVDS